MLKGSPDLRVGVAATLVIVPDDGAVWSSPTCTVYDPNGASVATPTVSVDGVATTIADATDTETFSVDDASDINAGSFLHLESIDGDVVFEVRTKSGTDITPMHPLPILPQANDTVSGLELSIPLTAANLGTRGKNYLCEVVTATGNHEPVTFSVVRHPFAAPLSATEIREYVWQVHGRAVERQEAENLRREVEIRMRQRLKQSAWYADQIWDREALRPSALECLRLILAERGQPPGAVDPDRYLEDQRIVWDRAIGAVVHSLVAYDTDDNNSTDDENAAARVGMMRMSL